MAENNGLLWTILVLSIICLLGLGFVVFNLPVTPTFPTAQEIGVEVGKNIVIPVAPTVNTSGLLTDEDIAPLLADDKWEEEALKIATDEWSAHDYKDIYKAIDTYFGNIVDKEDISSVTVTDDNVRRADADDKDARVTQTVKVKYEDDEGDNKKVYFDITTKIKEGEVDEQDIVPA